MTKRIYIGWSRDNKGKIVKRPVKQIANAITQATGGAHICEEGLSNTEQMKGWLQDYFEYRDSAK